jgi:hypothetical protein
MKGRNTAGAGLSLGALLALPAVAQAEDFQVTNLNDDGAGSLREAIEDSNDNPAADRILFKSKLSGTIHLEGPDPDIRDDVSIVGPGARKVTVSGDEQRVFFIQGDIDVDISGLSLTGGNAGPSFSGGGIVLLDGVNLTLSRSVISGNASSEDGGGIAGYGAPLNRLTVEDSTISGNSAEGFGGGIRMDGGYMTIRDSTISGNAARYGGGVALFGGPNPATVEILNSTVSENSAVSGGGVAVAYAGAEIHGSIVAGNSAPSDPDLSAATPWPTSFSLIGDTSGAQIENEGGNLLNVDPNLKPLADNGGPTDTHAFKKSPVKNKIPKGQTPKDDQRGAPRKGKGDIGAYELVKCEGVVVNRVGTAKKDKLKGTKRKDGILGLGGNDKLSGKKGKDGLCGGSGKDKLRGGPGKDKLNGGPGKDKEVQ